MIKDLLHTAQLLEKELMSSSPMMRAMKPKFVLTGSVAEGTRIGLGNEIDITLRFEGWKTGSKAPFAFVGSEPFFLHRGQNVPKWLEWYFIKGRFQLERFKQDLLDLVDSALGKLFQSGCNPPRLQIRPNVQEEKRTFREPSTIGKSGKSWQTCHTVVAWGGSSTRTVRKTFCGPSSAEGYQTRLSILPQHRGSTESKRPKEAPQPQGCYHCAEVHVRNVGGLTTSGNYHEM